MRIARLLASLVSTTVLASACLPIPQLRLELDPGPPAFRADPERVLTALETVPGAEAPDTPPHLNASYVLRYHLDAPDTIVIVVPGIFGGATSVDALARQLVAAVPALEVWALDRRSNGLEDRSAFRDAIAARDPRIARSYYLGSSDGAGAFHAPSFDDVPYLAGWGLDVHLRDLDAVVSRARERADRVVLAGHSLGAAIVSLYASYRWVAGPREGQERIDGLVLLDGALGRTGTFRIGDVMPGLLGTAIVPGAADVAQGRYPPYLDLVVGPRYFLERAVVALEAAYRPDESAPRDAAPAPISNLALAGIKFDDETHPLPIFGVSVGHPEGAVFDGNLPAVMLTGVHGLRSRSVSALAAGADRIEWSAGDPRREKTDLRALVRAWTHPAADYNEWYFPLRLALDIAELDPQLLDEPSFVPTADVAVPTIAFGAGRGLVTDVGRFSTYTNLRYGSPVSTYVVPGHTHIDIVTARDNPVVTVLARWLERLPRAEGRVR